MYRVRRRRELAAHSFENRIRHESQRIRSSSDSRGDELVAPVGTQRVASRRTTGSLSFVTIDVEFGSPLPSVEIVGDRYRLRPFRPEDLDLVEEASRDDFIPLITSVPSRWTPQEGQAFIDRQTSRLSNGEGWSLAIVDHASGRAVGQIGLWISHLHKGRVEIGYWIAASARGGGAASFAVQILSDWAFDNLDVDRLSLFIEPWNTASIKTAERSGYELEGLLRRWERVGGESRDMGSYVRTRPDQLD